MSQAIIESYESEVRSYCRAFPTVFTTARGSIMTDVDGRDFIDFFCGAGALNYGHNPDFIKERLVDHLQSSHIVHALDMNTVAKREFLEALETRILKPRGFDYKVQFTGPTGTNAVEAALKLARKVTKRTNIFAFMGCFHGMSLGSLALTSDAGSRAGAGMPMGQVTHLPAPYQFGEDYAIEFLRTVLCDDHSGIDKPAAIVLETVQAEGGIHVLSNSFLQAVETIAHDHDVLVIVDDIQVGCSRTGTFLSFERAGIHPDMVCLSKSISAFGLPFAVTLLKPELDIWTPAEHNGTFRANQLALVAGTAGIDITLDQHVEAGVRERGEIVAAFLNSEIRDRFEGVEVRGLGLIWGIDVHDDATCARIQRACFERGLIIERAGRHNGVLKLMPSLVIPEDTLRQGLEIIRDAMAEVLTY